MRGFVLAALGLLAAPAAALNITTQQKTIYMEFPQLLTVVRMPSC